jgi:hypothetical protein
MQWLGGPSEQSATKDPTLRLLEEIKEQLNRLEKNMVQDRDETEKAIKEIQSRLQNPLSEISVPNIEPSNPDLKKDLDLTNLLPLLGNSENLLSSPLLKLIPLFSNDKYLKLLDLMQKVQKGELPPPSELLPIARAFFGETVTAQTSSKVPMLQNMSNQLYTVRSNLESTLERLDNINTEASALLELIELFSAKRRLVP